MRYSSCQYRCIPSYQSPLQVQLHRRRGGEDSAGRRSHWAVPQVRSRFNDSRACIITLYILHLSIYFYVVFTTSPCHIKYQGIRFLVPSLSLVTWPLISPPHPHDVSPPGTPCSAVTSPCPAGLGLWCPTRASSWPTLTWSPALLLCLGSSSSRYGLFAACGSHLGSKNLLCQGMVESLETKMVARWRHMSKQSSTANRLSSNQCVCSSLFNTWEGKS